MHSYGSQNWESLWKKLEQAGNIGIDYIINPYLYPVILKEIAEHPKSLIVDFGCGTNIMGIELLFGYMRTVPGLRNVSDLGISRFNTLLYLGLDGAKDLVIQSNKYLQDIGNPTNLATIHTHIATDASIAFDNASIDLCVSRNFLMHLPPESLERHISEVAKMLKKGGKYVLALLNPEYEQVKYGDTLNEGERYSYPHGKEGEYGTFYHYYKSILFCEEVFKKNFIIESREVCLPQTGQFKESHSRYYNHAVPIAFVYILSKYMSK